MSFTEALKFTLKWEGGYVDHPNDYGDATNYGITQATYDDYLNATYLYPRRRSVSSITPQEVRNIYYNRYWLPSKAGTMERRLGVVHFDTAVNFGLAGATMFLQEALGLAPDGLWGPVTQAAFEKANGLTLAKRYLDCRVNYRYKRVQQDPTQVDFLKGWLNRDSDLEHYVKALVVPQRKAA